MIADSELLDDSGIAAVVFSGFFFVHLIHFRDRTAAYDHEAVFR